MAAAGPPPRMLLARLLQVAVVETSGPAVRREGNTKRPLYKATDLIRVDVQEVATGKQESLYMTYLGSGQVRDVYEGRSTIFGPLVLKFTSLDVQAQYKFNPCQTEVDLAAKGLADLCAKVFALDIMQVGGLICTCLLEEKALYSMEKCLKEISVERPTMNNVTAFTSMIMTSLDLILACEARGFKVADIRTNNLGTNTCSHGSGAQRAWPERTPVFMIDWEHCEYLGSTSVTAGTRTRRSNQWWAACP